MKNVLIVLLMIITIGCNSTKYQISSEHWITESIYATSDSNRVIGCRIVGYSSPLFDGIFPSKIDGKKVLEIASKKAVKPIFTQRADTSFSTLDFSHCNYLESIHSDAFYGCKGLKKVVLNKNLKTIGNGAFADCRSIESLEWGDKVELIGEGAFYNWDAMKSFSLPASLDSIKPYAFYSCNTLLEIKFNKGLLFIGERAFANSNNIETLEFPASLSYIGSRAFLNCKRITELTLPHALVEIADRAFFQCEKLSRLNIKSEKLIKIGPKTFTSTAIMMNPSTSIIYPRKHNYPETENWSAMEAKWLAK